MKQANVSQLKNGLSRYLAYVRRGGVVRVFDRDRPVAELVPVGRAAAAGSAELDGILADLERKGVVRRGSGALPRELVDAALPEATSSVLDALLAERREGAVRFWDSSAVVPLLLTAPGRGRGGGGRRRGCGSAGGR